ncbi:hypothetical protein [Sphingobacterium lactis]|uniref:hypothetical protein n=1 Tax=Sphingobacterium lactis TaxID=797291 RepID=UPI003DA62CE4
MENLEREFPEFVENENVSDVLDARDTEENAMRDAKMIEGSVCGPHGSRMLYARNAGTTRPIGITVEIKWIYMNEQRTESRVYTIYPQQQEYLGCPIPGPTMQRFDYKIVAAWYI